MKNISPAINNSEVKDIILQIKKNPFIHIPPKIDLGTTSVPTLKSFPWRLFSWAMAQPGLLIAMRPA